MLARDTTAAPEAGAPPTRDVAGRLLAPHLLLALVVVLAVVAHAAAFRGRYVDDAYIQLAYAQALVTDGTWGLSPGRVANTATSPLNVMVTAAVGLALGSLVDAAYWLIVVELLALLGVLLLLSRGLVGHAYFGVFAFVAFATNPLLLSTLGLELLLYTLLFVVAPQGTVVARLGQEGPVRLPCNAPVMPSAPAQRHGFLAAGAPLVIPAHRLPWLGVTPTSG